MVWQRPLVAIILGISLLAGMAGCSSSQLPASGLTMSQANQAEMAAWVKQQTQLKNKSIRTWSEIASNSKLSLADRKVAGFAVNALSQDLSTLTGKAADRQSMLNSLLNKDSRTSKKTFGSRDLSLPSLSAVKIEEKSQLDDGKTMYRLTGTVFTSVPNKLYSVTITLRTGRSGKIEQVQMES
ncbi:hypothetical protein [Aneurinibacillus terranovensis]|uniref:hypothetical protein n=1 Tax=Aneurinibacillus terranovensis TaxID=278991 RepID=UPI00042974A8|nr:hypothetical protein [Aneurinibacillus terranovensis]